jgi:HSP20 family molecular chaperone IbpA
MMFNTISIAVAAAAIAPSFPLTDGYMYSVYPNCRPPSRDAFSSSVRSERYRQRQARVNKAFNDLQRELYNEAQRNNGKKIGQFDWMVVGPTAAGDFQQVDKEAVKKWVDKAFDLASEFNQDFSTSPKERETNDELLKKSREFVERMYSKENSNDGGDTNKSRTPAEDESNHIEKPKDDQEITLKDNPNKEPDPETPYSENRSDKSTFQVAVDLPGVDRADVYISLEEDYLVVQAERRANEYGQIARKYLNKFSVIQEEIEVDEMKAALENGVLVVSAPKKVKEEKETSRKIPLA